MEQNNQEFYSGWAEMLFVIAGICFIIYLIHTIISFKTERDYIKMELERSTKEKERKFWQEELKRFYLRKIPIIGELLINDEKNVEYEDEYDIYDK